MSTSSPSTLESENRLWGIYYTDREYAREMGDPLRTTLEAPTKEAAEEEARRLGFSDAWANPIAANREKATQRREGQRSELRATEPPQMVSKNHRSISQPTSAQLQTAIEVLRLLGERITKRATDSVMLWGEELPGQGQAKSIEQNTHIHTIAGELEQWRNEVRQQRRQHVVHHI